MSTRCPCFFLPGCRETIDPTDSASAPHPGAPDRSPPTPARPPAGPPLCTPPPRPRAPAAPPPARRPLTERPGPAGREVGLLRQPPPPPARPSVRPSAGGRTCGLGADRVPSARSSRRGARGGRLHSRLGPHARPPRAGRPRDARCAPHPRSPPHPSTHTHTRHGGPARGGGARRASTRGCGLGLGRGSAHVRAPRAGPRGPRGPVDLERGQGLGAEEGPGVTGASPRRMGLTLGPQREGAQPRNPRRGREGASGGQRRAKSSGPRPGRPTPKAVGEGAPGRRTRTVPRVGAWQGWVPGLGLDCQVLWTPQSQ